MAYISRNPFAREEIHRESIRPGDFGIKHVCAWCGNTNAHGNVFQYRVESDGGRKSEIPGHFCSIGCMRTYHT